MKFPKVSALVDWLTVHDLPVLEDLQRQYPESAERILKAGTPLGASSENSRLDVYLDLAVAALDSAVVRGGEAIDSIVTRLRSAKRMRLAGGVVSAIGSGGVVGATLGASSAALVLAVVTFLGTSVVLVAEYLERSIQGEDLASSLRELIDATTRAEALASSLRLEMSFGTVDSEKVLSIVQDANALVARLNLLGRLS